jgi:hypothetical protein
MRPTLAWLFAPLALLGLAGFLSLCVMLAAVQWADLDLSDTVAWTWIGVGWLGLVAALCFGTMALMVSRPSGPVWVRGRRIGLGVVGVVLLIVAVVQVVGSTATMLALLAAGVAALVVLWWDVRQG